MIMDRVARKTIEERGSCGPDTADLFGTEKPEYEAKAKAICSTCPVRQECLIEYWFEAGVVVGGTTWKERQVLTRKGVLPDIPHGRLVESHDRGGTRAIMLWCNQDEADAIELAKRLNKQGPGIGVGDRGRYTGRR